MTFQDFLLVLQSTGINAAIGIIMSFVVEWWPQYGTLEAKTKRVIFLALCLFVPVFGATAGVGMGYQSGVFDVTYWPALVAGGAAFATGTAVHIRKM